MQDILLPAAAILAVLNALSLLAKSEGYRAIGRIAGGVSVILLGVYLSYLLPAITQQFAQFLSAWLLVGCGAITVASGARKFRRRNLSQAN